MGKIITTIALSDDDLIDEPIIVEEEKEIEEAIEIEKPILIKKPIIVEKTIKEKEEPRKFNCYSLEDLSRRMSMIEDILYKYYIGRWSIVKLAKLYKCDTKQIRKFLKNNDVEKLRKTQNN